MKPSFLSTQIKKTGIVELGAQGAGSKQMWKAYFGDGAKIYGIDIDKGIQNLPFEGFI
jgi:hypothetical protein